MTSIPECLACLREGRADRIPRADARHLAGAMLDGGLLDVEVGAMLATLAGAAPQADMLEAWMEEIAARLPRWPVAAACAPVVLGCYGGAREVPSLVPALALMLAGQGVPVLVHGPIHALAGVGCALVLRELDILPCTHPHRVLEELQVRRIAFAPTALLAPGLAALLALRPRIGPCPVLVTAARLIDPFGDEGCIVAGADDEVEMSAMHAALSGRDGKALLLEATDGEPVVSPLRRSTLVCVRGGTSTTLFEREPSPSRRPLGLPEAGDIVHTAAWIRQIASGARPAPPPIVNQVAACLYGSGYCEDLNEAKALAAIAAGGRRVA